MVHLGSTGLRLGTERFSISFKSKDLQDKRSDQIGGLNKTDENVKSTEQLSFNLNCFYNANEAGTCHEYLKQLWTDFTTFTKS